MVPIMVDIHGIPMMVEPHRTQLLSLGTAGVLTCNMSGQIQFVANGGQLWRSTGYRLTFNTVTNPTTYISDISCSYDATIIGSSLKIRH